jgi:LysM repeat protein
VSRTDLAEANNLSTRSRVRVGQELIIPRAPATLLAGRTERTAPAEVASRALTGTVTVADATPRTESPVVYRVKRGDTLFSIAQLFDTTVARIKSLNRLRGNAVVAGARLKIAR